MAMCRVSCVRMPTNLKLDDKLIADAVKLGKHKTKQDAVNAALAEYVQHRNQLRILELEGKIRFRPDWDYKKMRRAG
jgi:Arc/MetJ family transcription regulator